MHLYNFHFYQSKTYLYSKHVKGLRGWEVGYRFAFNGQEKDDEISGAGNNLNYGDRVLDTRLGRWFKLDVKEGKYTSWSAYHYGFNNPIVTVDENGKENIVVAGGQYDPSAGNKLMFVHQALRQLRQYQVDEKEESRSLVLFTEGYTEKQIKRIEKEAAKLGATVVKVNSAQELTNYVNSKSKEVTNLSTFRTSDPITNVDIFAHGVVGSIEFGYKQSNADAAKFDASAISKINSVAFGKDALICSYACRTALGNHNINVWAAGIEDRKMEKSLAQTLSYRTGATVKAFASRSDYSNTLSSSNDRLFLKLGLSTPVTNDLKIRLQGRENIDGATFDPQGAVHPVIGGSTPVGVTSDVQTFTPKH